ncbi:hypothetical protein AgCh_000462 [Apium graveolens]
MGLAICLTLILLTTTLTVKACPPSDQAALQAIKAALYEPSLGIFDTWTGNDSVGWGPAKQNRRGVASPRHLRREDEKGASGRLGCVRVLSDLDRKNVLDSGCLEGGDVATCPGLPKVNAESVRVLSDPEHRNVLDPGNLDGGDAATCPGILCLGPGPLQLGLTYYGLSFAPHSLMRVYPDGGVE